MSNLGKKADEELAHRMHSIRSRSRPPSSEEISLKKKRAEAREKALEKMKTIKKLQDTEKI